MVYMDLISRYCHDILPDSSALKFDAPLTMQDFPEITLKISYANTIGDMTHKKVRIGFEPLNFDKAENGEGHCMLRVRNIGEEILEI